MNIKKIVIYGFGKHENKTINFNDGVNILYGHNEAGKTTIQQFILQIFFGFPQKKSVQLRYEPKSGGKFGGQVYVYDETYGDCIIERVRGKSSGDVTVYFQDGTQGGEDALKGILRQYDRASFESVFSFSVLQLQGFERMDESELSRTLLASGTTGVDSLMNVEKKMEKEAGDLFKRAGRVPEMNVRLQELKEIEEDLKKEQARLLTYSPKVNRIYDIEREWSNVKKEYDDVRNHSRKLEIQLQLLPLNERKKTIVDKLSSLRKGEFPADGIRRYEIVNSRLTEMEAKMFGLKDEIKTMSDRLLRNPILENLTSIERLLAREPEWHEWRTGVNTIHENIRQLKSKKSQLLDRLGLEQANEILRADVSIHQEEKLYTQLQKAVEMDQHLNSIDRQLTQMENELSDLRVEQRAIQENEPSAEEERQVAEWPSIRGKLAEARAYLQMNQSNTTSGTPVASLLLLVVALVVIVFGVIEKQWIVVVLGICIAVTAALQTVGKRKQAPKAKQIEMQQVVSKFAEQENRMEQLIEKVHAYRLKQTGLVEEISSTDRKMRILETEYETIAQEKEVVEEALSGFFFTYGMTKIPNSGILHEFFGMARALQEIERDTIELQQRQRSLLEQINSRVIELRAHVQENIAEETLYEKLRTAYIALQSEKQACASIAERLKKTEVEYKEVDELLSSLKAQKEALFAEAGVETEEQYYKAYKEYDQTLLLTSQLDTIEAQLNMQGAIEVVAGINEIELREEIVSVEQEISKMEGKLDLLVQEKASLKAETEKLLTDDAYQTKQQYFEMKKAELAELSIQWATRQVIVQSISSMMKELKDRKLPDVLQQAQALFCELTGGVYESLEITEDGLFRAVATNGMRYPIIELSQATKEQAYISLRLALAMTMKSSAPFPILLDDPFVHFDELRLSRMINIVEQLSGKHQFIYMTCHDKIIEEWANATIINVSEIGNDKGAMAR